jgi:hypothetical protein
VRLEANVEEGGVETSTDFVRLGGAAADGADPSPGFVRLELDVEGTSTTPVLVCLQAAEVEGVTTSPDDFVRLEAAVVEGVDTSPGFVSLELADVVEGDDTSSGFVSLELADVEGVNVSSPPPRPTL